LRNPGRPVGNEARQCRDASSAVRANEVHLENLFAPCPHHPATTATMANVEINLPLPVLPEGWAGEKDFKPVGSLSKTNDRKIEPVGPHFLAYARRVRSYAGLLQVHRTYNVFRSATSALSPRMSASRPRPTSRASRKRTQMTSTSPRTPRCFCARPRTGSRRTTMLCSA
jgi:hypothetical protein